MKPCYRAAFWLLLAVAIHHPAFAQADGYEQFAFAHDSVTFMNGTVRLSGAFFRPNGKGPFPAVVIVHGAGPSTYNEPAFRIHANALLRSGFAVLTYDKRGSGASTGDLDVSDYSDLANDALAGVRWLRSRADILPAKVGLLGRSEGGWVIALAASRDPKVAFLVMSSGCAVRPFDEVVYWTRGALRAHGAPDSVVARAIALKEAVWAYYRGITDDTIVGHSAQSVGMHDWLAAQLSAFDHYRPEVPSGVANPVKNPVAYFRAFTNNIYYDPTSTLNALHTPVLMILGANDDVVEPSTTIAVLDRLRLQGHDVSYKVYPGVGHPLLEAARAGQPPFYPDGYLDLITNWARQRVAGR